MPNAIPIDPKLPKNFDDTANEERSKNELDHWWDHPYCLTQPDGRYLVRCLNGGAWDRSTVFGMAETYLDACMLAQAKQAEWVQRRGEAILTMSGAQFGVMIQAQRPDQEPQYFDAPDQDSAMKLVERLNDPETHHLFGSPANARHLEESIAQAERGETSEFDQDFNFIKERHGETIKKLTDR